MTTTRTRTRKPKTEDLTPADVDWTVIEDDRVMEVIRQAARSVAASYQGVVTSDDLEQDVTIWAAANADTVREYLADELFGVRNLYRNVSHRMIDIARKAARVSNRNVPFHKVIEQGVEGE